MNTAENTAATPVPVLAARRLSLQDRYSMERLRDLSLEIYKGDVIALIGASEDGKRLGHGAGYYDRFLTQSGGRTVCLCFSAALCGDIPTEPTDVRMHLVVSE